MRIHIRPARPDDAEGIVAVFNPIIEAGIYTAFTTPFSAAAEREFIRTFPARGIFHVALRRDDGRIVGFQSMSPFSNDADAFAHVGVLGTFVDLACRRQGIAKQLFAATLQAAPAKGYAKMFTYVRADNPAALAVYLKQGFQIVGTAQRHVKIGEQYIDEVIIEKLL